MDSDTLRALASGLMGALVVVLLSRAGRRPAARQGGLRVLRYGLGFRIFAAVLLPFSLFVAYGASQARPSQALLAAAIAAAFLSAGVFFAYQVFAVSLAYDEQNVYYRSPFMGTLMIPWSEVQEVRYSGFMQSYYLRTRPVRRIWCSSMQEGYDELGEHLSRKADELFGDRDPSVG